MYLTVHGTDGVYLDEQMITKDPLNLILVPFIKCLPEDSSTTCSAVSFYFVIRMCFWKVCYV